VRLRTLSEAECYARCYGGHGDVRVALVPLERGERRLLPSRHETGAGVDPRLLPTPATAEAA
jgi:hypothetical protein